MKPVMLLFIFLIFSCAHGYLDEPEGTSCTWERAEGKCLKARQCLSFVVENISGGKWTLFPGKKPPICSFQGKEPIICCVSCDNLGTNVKDLHQNKRFNSGRKYEEQCLLYQHLLPYECSEFTREFYDRYNLNGVRDNTPELYKYGKFNETRKCYEYEKIPGGWGGGGAGGEDSKRGDFPHMVECLLYQHLLPYECSEFTREIYDKYNLNGVRDNTPGLYKYGKFNETRKCYEYENSPGGWSSGGAGGEDSKRGDFPHMALLGFGEELDSVQWLCGGSLISERHILTAAHCASHPQLGPATYVALGMLKRSDPPHYWKRYKVRTFYNHEGYTPPHKYHDIAIVETELPVNLTSGVYPACLTHKFSFRGDDVAYATGWGALGPGKADAADVMQKVTVSKFTEAECSSQYPPHRHLRHGYNHTTQLCYGGREEVRDTCKGDSGGPLQKRDLDASYCQYAIIGVTSSGLACGTAGQAGLYTRVSYYLPWIESIVWP